MTHRHLPSMPPTIQTPFLYYAKNGMIRVVYNDANLNGTSRYYIRLEEGSTITYNPALASFTIPAGGDDTVGTALGTWEEE